MSQQHIMSKPADQSSAPKSAAAKLFDLRVMIGGLFTLYGVVLILAGIFASAAEIQKASGIDINLWMGIGMLIVGLLFLLWWRLHPLQQAVDAAHDVEPAAEYTETETAAGKGRNPF
jgi:xanthine/uracil/vitamin C permease (AzgA family)